MGVRPGKHRDFGWEGKRKDHAGGRMILKWILEKEDGYYGLH
jgi:hypothetical protein